MPACGQAVGCGVCDTPELWRGAAGLCARVRACAGAAESLHTYIHTKVCTQPHTGKQGEATSQHSHIGQHTLRHEVPQAWGAKDESRQHLACATRFGLYKRFVCLFWDCELVNTTLGIQHLFYCNPRRLDLAINIAQYMVPPRPPCFAIHHAILVKTMSCKGQNSFAHY